MLKLCSAYLDECDIVLVAALGWGKVVTTRRELVFVVIYDGGVEEVREDGEETAAVPVVCNSTSIITLSCHIADRLKRDVVILIQVHLQEGTGEHIIHINIKIGNDKMRKL